MRGEVRRCQKHTRHYSPLVASFGTLHCTVPCSPPTYDLRSCRDTNYTIFAQKKGGTAQQSASKCSADLKDSLVGGFNRF